MDGEEVRDLALSASGLLNPKSAAERSAVSADDIWETVR